MFYGYTVINLLFELEWHLDGIQKSAYLMPKPSSHLINIH